MPSGSSPDQPWPRTAGASSGGGTGGNGGSGAGGNGAGGQKPLPAGGCRDDADCSGDEECVAPGGLGGCIEDLTPDECTTDAGCPGQICDYPAKPSCSVQHRICRAACTPAECGDLAMCGAEGHCVDIPCGGDSQCGPDQACSSGKCIRRPCQSDGQCEGYCLFGGCSSKAGVCTYPE
ncbi:MAG: hypothetical protein QM820_31775 [Minicystis sp.]